MCISISFQERERERVSAAASMQILKVVVYRVLKMKLNESLLQSPGT